jgi:hypothetical protein
MLALLVLSIGVIGAGFHFGPRGVVGSLQTEIRLLSEAIGALAEQSQQHDEEIELILDHIRKIKASLCAFYETGPSPDICSNGEPDSVCVPGICDTTAEGDRCQSDNPPPACAAGGGSRRTLIELRIPESQDFHWGRAVAGNLGGATGRGGLVGAPTRFES